MCLTSLPGWAPGSWGYHGDDGQKYENNTGAMYAETFTTKDVIGCRVYLSQDVTFFKNGTSLGVAFRGISGKLYPAVGMRSRGGHVRVNFGQKPFLYNVTAP